MKTRRHQNRQQYILKRNEAETLKRSAQRNSWVKIGEDLERDLTGTRKLIFSLAKSYKKRKHCTNSFNKRQR